MAHHKIIFLDPLYSVLDKPKRLCCKFIIGWNGDNAIFGEILDRKSKDCLSACLDSNS